MSGDSPDWAALYDRHKDAMHRVAAKTLRDGGISDQAGDAVQDAMVSLMAAPPVEVRNWEAVMVTASKRRALDRLNSAAFRHAGPRVSDEQFASDHNLLKAEIKLK